MALRRARDAERRGTASALVIVGLANPGVEYEGSRHNVGGDAVRLVCERRDLKLKIESRQRAMSVTFSSNYGAVTLAVPTTYMNESGAAVVPLLRRTSLTDLSHLVIAHDELDLEPGRLQFKQGGGLAGHNGLRSIASALDTNDFSRLRIGIGKPPNKEQGADYVLQRPTGARKVAMQSYVAEAADALETLIDNGLGDAQRRVNGTRG